jgi:ribosome-associated toxin RatA of RatAB toxin-antitoxin module
LSAVTIEHIFDGNIEQVFEACRQYQEYPNFLPGVAGIEVAPAKEPKSTCQVRYEVRLIKVFHYTLNMFEEKPKKIWWHLDESNLMKKSNGSWEFTDLGKGRTKAVYSLDVGFSMFAPQKIVDQVAKANLPALMKGMQKLIDHHCGKS